ncbi:MAG TPA: transporter [Phycisphaerae bacterium]|nr:transporter [Phycisphaerae bacterium]
MVAMLASVAISDPRIDAQTPASVGDDPRASGDRSPNPDDDSGGGAEDAASPAREGLFRLTWRPPVEGALATDRPGFADTTVVLPPGYLQLELGYTYTYDSESDIHARDHALSQLNLRFGLLDNLEIRTLWSGYSMSEVEFTAESPRTGRRYRTADHDDGASDMVLGLRTQLLKNDGLVPDLTFLGNLAIPVGGDSKSAGAVVPDVRLAYGWLLTERLRLYGVGIAAAPVSDGERFFQAAGSAGLSYAWTDRLSSFVEYYGICPARRESDCAHTADGGFAFLINDNMQIDFSAGVGLNEEAPDYLVGIGVAFRW